MFSKGTGKGDTNHHQQQSRCVAHTEGHAGRWDLKTCLILRFYILSSKPLYRTYTIGGKPSSKKYLNYENVKERCFQKPTVGS